MFSRQVLPAVWVGVFAFGALAAGCNAPQGAAPTAASADSVAESSASGAESSRAASEQARPRRARPEKAAQPGVFDFYLLTLSWSPEYCVTHPTDAQCAAQPGFVLHGLWPENTNGTYPEDCSKAAGPSDPGQYADIYPDQSLLEHEWTTHGTCSGLGPDAFFTLERQAKQAVKIPANLAGKTVPAQETPAQILGGFATANGAPVGDFALSCGNNRLTAVQVCLDKTLKVISCAGVKSCGATVVKITAPGAASDSAR